MLVCPDCGRDYPDDGPWRCDCGSPLRLADPPRPARDQPPESLDRDAGIWAFGDFLPMDQGVSLGEGWTPLVEAPDWDANFKLDYLFPTASFKDRGAAATVSRAVELGVPKVLEDSSGNAGLAIATYAAAAGIDAEIYVPSDAKAGKVNAIERTGADVVRVEDDRQAVTDACVDAVEAGEGWYASHAWNPAFFAGTATFAFELAAQRDWNVPDAVVTPLGHGTLFLGAYRGFRALRDAGWTDDVPRLLGAQAAGVAPIVDALHGDNSSGDGGSSGESAAGERNDAADGIQITEPVQREAILAAIEATDGDAIAVDSSATEREADRLVQSGFHVEPTSAVATAALAQYRDRGVLAPNDDVVVALTGSGLKG